MEKTKRVHRRLKTKLANKEVKKKIVSVDKNAEYEKRCKDFERRRITLINFISSNKRLSQQRLRVLATSNTTGLVYRGATSCLWAKFNHSTIEFFNSTLRGFMLKSDVIKRVFPEYKLWR